MTNEEIEKAAREYLDALNRLLYKGIDQATLVYGENALELAFLAGWDACAQRIKDEGKEEDEQAR